MAGTLKPDSSLLTYENEAKCEILEYDGCWSSSTSPLGLLDGVSYSGWQNNVCYLYSDGAYFKFKVYSKCNIWAIGTDSYITYIATRLKLTDENGVDITSKYLNQDETSYTTDKWIKIITELPPGEYLLTASGRIVIGEWYCESIPSSFLIQNNGNFYITNEENYNPVTGKYTPVASYDFDDLTCDGLCNTPDYLNGLRPIDLFDGDIQMIYKDDYIYSINGIKSSKELVVATGDINKELAQTINSITVETVKTNNGNLKLAVSIDKGKTWKTHDGANWVDLSITIPSTEYSTMTTDEKLQWNNARDIIASKGIDTGTFNSIDFNTLTDDNTAPGYLRFAYVLIRPTYTDDVKTTKLNWDFNAKGNMDLMIPGTEYNLSLYEKEARFTSLIDNELVKVNFLI